MSESNNNNQSLLIVIVIVAALAIGYFLFKNQIMSALSGLGYGNAGSLNGYGLSSAALQTQEPSSTAIAASGQTSQASNTQTQPSNQASLQQLGANAIAQIGQAMGNVFSAVEANPAISKGQEQIANQQLIQGIYQVDAAVSGNKYNPATNTGSQGISRLLSNYSQHFGIS